MAKVKLNLLNIFQLKLNKKFIEYEGNTIGDIISKFINENKEKLDDNILIKNKKRLDPQMLILLNGRNIKYLNNYKTKIKDGDELYLSFPMAGG
ncbi:MAG: MoaD/ThiS family protein [Promethearchaeota archaeon]